jgi:hypothetical protein
MILRAVIDRTSYLESNQPISKDFRTMNTPFQDEPHPPHESSPAAPVGGPWLRTLRVIFTVMFVSVVVYALIGTFLSRTPSLSNYDLQGMYRIFSYIGGLCVAGLLLIRNLISRALKGVEPGLTPRFRQTQRYRALTVVAFALSEAIAVLGLVFVLLGGQLRILYIFCAISLACLILFFPRDDE